MPELELCIKFAGLLINMVRHVKSNRLTPSKNQPQKPNHESPEYFIHSGDLKKFFNVCHTPITIYVPLSVGQPYHEDISAASQVACLQNLQYSYESWLQDQITRNTVSPKKTKIKWNICVVVADVTQALNKIDPVEIDLFTPYGQCNTLLQDRRLINHESEFVEKGRALEKNYYSLLSKNLNTENKDVDVSLRMRRSQTIRWSSLKRHYNDPTITDIINRLEHCFKLGAQAINERKPEGKKFPTEIETLYQKDAFVNWASDVKVNDLAYVIIEDIMIHCKILPSPVPGEVRSAAMMYPGPLNMLLDTGKKILACVCKNLITKIPISDVSCIYLQAEKNNPKDTKQDKNASLFLGKCDVAGRRLSPDNDTLMRQIKFIDAAVPVGIGVQFANAAMKATLKEVAEKDLEKQATFELGPYATFLQRFSDEYQHYSDMIHGCCQEGKLIWDNDNPILSIFEFFNALSSEQQPSEVSGSQQTMSMSVSFFQQPQEDQGLLTLKLEALSHKYQRTRDSDKHKEYLIKAACRLVQYAVEIQNQDGQKDLSPQMRKKSKSLPFFGTAPVEDLNEAKEMAEFFASVVRPASEQLPLLGCLYYIRNVITLLGNDVSVLNNFRYYNHPIPEADYHSTQSSQQSGSIPLSQSK